MKQTFALRGNLVYTKKIGTMEILEHQYLVCADGRVQGIYPELPQQFCGIPVEDMETGSSSPVLRIFTFMHRSIRSGD